MIFSPSSGACRRCNINSLICLLLTHETHLAARCSYVGSGWGERFGMSDFGPSLPKHESSQPHPSPLAGPSPRVPGMSARQGSKVDPSKASSESKSDKKVKKIRRRVVLMRVTLVSVPTHLILRKKTDLQFFSSVSRMFDYGHSFLRRLYLGTLRTSTRAAILTVLGGELVRSLPSSTPPVDGPTTLPLLPALQTVGFWALNFSESECAKAREVNTLGLLVREWGCGGGADGLPGWMLMNARGQR